MALDARDKRGHDSENRWTIFREMRHASCVRCQLLRPAAVGLRRAGAERDGLARAVVGDERVLAMELVAPDGRRIRNLSMAQDTVYERYGSGGAYLSDRPAYLWRPRPFGWGSPFWDPWPGRHGFWDDGPFFGPFWPAPVPRSKSYALSVGRILVGDTAYFRQTWPQWHLRLAYGDGRVVELRVPSVEYQG
jgi:hypothetical protein